MFLRANIKEASVRWATARWDRGGAKEDEDEERDEEKDEEPTMDFPPLKWRGPPGPSLKSRSN
jgi:hypothetical protein